MTSDITIPYATITEIRYRKDEPLRESGMICAAIVAGAAIGIIFAPPDQERKYPGDLPVIRDNKWKNGLLGGAVGLGVGVLLSLVINSTVTIQCP